MSKAMTMLHKDLYTFIVLRFAASSMRGQSEKSLEEKAITSLVIGILKDQEIDFDQLDEKVMDLVRQAMIDVKKEIAK